MQWVVTADGCPPLAVGGMGSNWTCGNAAGLFGGSDGDSTDEADLGPVDLMARFSTRRLSIA